MTFSYTQPYIVVGALVVRDDKFLLVKEGHMPDKGKWNIPAGKLDYGEDPVVAARREVYEETGLEFEPGAIIGLHSVLRQDVPEPINTTHVLRIVYSGKCTGDTNNEHGDTDEAGPEIEEFAWLTAEEVLSMDSALLRYHDIKDYVRAYLADKSYPIELITHFVQKPL